MANTFRVTEWTAEISAAFSMVRHLTINGEYITTWLADADNRDKLAEKYGKVKVDTGAAKRSNSCPVRLRFCQEATGSTRKSGTVAEVVDLLAGRREWAVVKTSYVHSAERNERGYYDYTEKVWTSKEQAEYWLYQYPLNIFNAVVYSIARDMVKQLAKEGKIKASSPNGYGRFTQEASDKLRNTRDELAKLMESFSEAFAPVWSDYVI